MEDLIFEIMKRSTLIGWCMAEWERLLKPESVDEDEKADIS